MELAKDSSISLEDGKTIIAELLVGVAKNIEKSVENLQSLEKQVSIPDGTTVEAIKVFDQHNLKQIILSALSAVVKRSQELEKIV